MRDCNDVCTLFGYESLSDPKRAYTAEVAIVHSGAGMPRPKCGLTLAIWPLLFYIARGPETEIGAEA